MESFWQTLYPYGHLAVAIIEVILLLFAYPFFRLSQNQAMIVLPIVLVSTIYDNIILWSGRWIGEGELLETLSQVRFLLHYLAVPLLIVVAIELAHQSEAKWATQWLRVSSWLLAFGLAGYDVINNFIGLELQPDLFANVLRYIPVQAQIPVITIIINLFVLAVGIGIWVRTKNWRWLFIGALISFVGNAFPTEQVGTLPGSASECLLSLSLLLTQYHLEDIEEEEEEEEIIPPEGWQTTEYEGYKIFWKSADKYTIYQTGEHREGDFIRIYAPKNPYIENGKKKVITYLHGFALCMPKFYEQHLEELASEGYYVFFPDYQRSDYPNFPKDDETYEDYMGEDATVRYGLLGTGILLIQLILRREANKQEIKKLAKQSILEAFRLVLGRLLFIIVANIFSVFDRQYAKNLISMITTVIASLTDTPMRWLAFAVDTTAIAWEKLSQHHQQEYSPELKILEEEDIDFYVFGHSLGGLLALSWPYYLQQNPDKIPRKFQPKQIITSDPAPNTALGIPKIALWVLGIFRFPFATKPLNIKETGTQLTLPVGILHGNNDKIVKPTEWVKPPKENKNGSFFEIKSDQKKIYFSLSNKAEKLIADHNQSVTDTTYYGDGFMANFGGAKDDPNAYNFQYIWPALDAVIKNQVEVYQLKNGEGFELHDFGVVDDEPISD
jgi:hypothetical protein